MKKICLYFQLHQPYRLRTYRFFDIGQNHDYFNDYENRSIIRRLTEKCYLPANKILLELLKQFDGKFKISFSLSGVFLDQIQQYAPEVLESFQKLAQSKNVEFLAETDAHSLISLKDKNEFLEQIKTHSNKIKTLFNYQPVTFRNTELIYSNEIGKDVYELGFKGVIAEGAKHILGWRSPNFLYFNPICPQQKVLLRNYKLSDDITLRFSDKNWDQWPLTSEKYASWVNQIDSKEDIINLFMNYDTFGEHHSADSGILGFLQHLPKSLLKYKKLEFVTPAEAVEKLQPVSSINVHYPTSWTDEERDTTAWLGNDLQNDAFDKLYEMLEFIQKSNEPEFKKIFNYLQASDHFNCMSTKWFSQQQKHLLGNHYGSPYEAYINYRNVLNDFKLQTGFIGNVNHQLEQLQKLTAQQEELIRELQQKIEPVKPTKNEVKPAKKEVKTVKSEVKTTKSKTEAVK